MMELDSRRGARGASERCPCAMEEGRERLLEVPGDLKDTGVEVVELLKERGAHVW